MWARTTTSTPPFEPFSRRIKHVYPTLQGNTDGNVGEDYNVDAADEGPRPFVCILDTGLKRTSTGSKVWCGTAGRAGREAAARAQYRAQGRGGDSKGAGGAQRDREGEAV